MIAFENGLVNRGLWGDIQQVMDRAARGEPITVAFLGGSITYGAAASSPEKCYAYLTCRWWQEKFPNARITYVNAGIGGTSSQFGAARVEEDVLQHKPDFLLTEFSVNDENTPFFQETYESLIRRILRHPLGLLLMNNVRYSSGSSAEEVHLAVARHYSLPSVSMKPTIYAALCRGEMEKQDITPDGLHPNDRGHALVAQVICHQLEEIWAAPREAGPGPLPAPMTPNRFEASRRYRNDNSHPLLAGFVPDPEPQECVSDCFRRGYTAWKVGDSIRFTLEGSCIGVQYRKSAAKPTPIAKITVDGEEEKSLLLDGNFQDTWGDWLCLDTVAEDLHPGEHSVEITVVEAHADDVVPFYLVSVIGA